MTKISGIFTTSSATLQEIGSKQFYMVGRTKENMRLCQVKYIGERVIGFIDPSRGSKSDFVIDKSEVEQRVEHVLLRSIDGDKGINRVKIDSKNWEKIAKGIYAKVTADGMIDNYGKVSITKIYLDEISGKAIYSNQNDITLDDVFVMLQRSHVYFEITDKNGVVDYFSVYHFDKKGKVKLTSVIDGAKENFAAEDFVDKLNEGLISVYFNRPAALDRPKEEVKQEVSNSVPVRVEDIAPGVHFVQVETVSPNGQIETVTPVEKE